MTVQRTDYSDRSVLAEGLAHRVAEELAAVLNQQPRATLAVPGGTTPGAFLAVLSHADLDWSRIDVVLTDERWVPTDSPRSNFGLLQRTLLQHRAAVAEALALYREAERPEDVLDELETDVRRRMPVDVCVLGMGVDGHTASLFPGADRLEEALSEQCPYAVLPIRAPGAEEPRITLTAPVLRDARHIHLLIAGEEKELALARALQPGPHTEAPVRVVLHGTATRVHYASR